MAQLRLWSVLDHMISVPHSYSSLLKQFWNAACIMAQLWLWSGYGLYDLCASFDLCASSVPHLISVPHCLTKYSIPHVVCVCHLYGMVWPGLVMHEVCHGMPVLSTNCRSVG